MFIQFLLLFRIQWPVEKVTKNIWLSVGQINFWVIIFVRSKVKEVILELKDANS